MNYWRLLDSTAKAMNRKSNAIKTMLRKKTSALAWNDAQNAIIHKRTALKITNKINFSAFVAREGCFCVFFIVFYFFSVCDINTNYR